MPAKQFSLKSLLLVSTAAALVLYAAAMESFAALGIVWFMFSFVGSQLGRRRGDHPILGATIGGGLATGLVWISHWLEYVLGFFFQELSVDEYFEDLGVWEPLFHLVAGSWIWCWIGLLGGAVVGVFTFASFEFFEGIRSHRIRPTNSPLESVLRGGSPAAESKPESHHAE
jgi:hypothetical protein